MIVTVPTHAGEVLNTLGLILAIQISKCWVQRTHLAYNMGCLETQSQPVTSNHVRDNKECHLIEKNNWTQGRVNINAFTIIEKKCIHQGVCDRKWFKGIKIDGNLVI